MTRQYHAVSLPALRRRRSANEWLVQETGERRGLAEHAQQSAIELRAGREGRRQLAPGKKLAELEILDRFVIVWKSAWGALKALTLEAAERPLESWRLDDRAKAVDVRRDVLANGLQLRGLRSVHAATDPDLVRRHVKVQSRALVLREVSRRKTRGDVRLVRR